MPLTAAEKQKKYRDKLKTENPQKYEEIRRKAKERSARHYEKKKSTYTEEQKQELRQKWKEDRKKAKYAKMAPLHEPPMSQASNSKQDNNLLVCRRMQSRVEYRLKQENVLLRSQLNTLTKGFKALQKKMIRQQNRIDKMQDDYENMLIKLDTEKETENKNIQELEEKTPRKKITEFINNNLPNIETPKKEEIKKKLLEHDILTESLKSQFKTANNAEKNVLKKILDNNIVKKYKFKTNIRTSLGFKSNFKNYRQHKTKTTALQKKIECFYNRDDVSRATAGKKEYRTFKKVTRQKRYLLDKLSVLHRKFVVEEAQISFSTFKKYRPFYVLSPKIKDCESCACKKHSNMQFLVDELKSLNILQTDNLNEVTSNLVCDFYSKDCMYNNCNTCSEIQLKVDNEKLLAKARWFTWVLKEHEYEKAGEKKTIKKMIKIKKEGTLKDLLETFNEEMKKFKTHIFNFYFQYKQYKDCINNLQDDEACIHIDFSENFTCKYHSEIQAMHFIKEQITLHTGVIYIKGEKKPISFCSISPDNQHNPEAIWAHLDPILKHIKSNYSKICTIHFFSDGPTTQYRQKKNFYLFSKKIYKYGYNYCTWSFFEAAHGKGAADGIGGVIKRTLDTKIAQGKDIPNAETAFDVLKSEDTSIKLFYISSHNIKPIQAKLSPLPQTMKIHQLITIEKLKLKHRELSCFCGAPRGSCECHSPGFHSFCPIMNTNELQANNRKQRTRQRRVSSSTEEDDDDIIEYAESDASAFLSDDSMGLDFNDDESNLITELDEKTGVLKPKIDPNKKVILLLTLILKKPDDKNNTKQEKKRKLLCENEEFVQNIFCETTKHIIEKDFVTTLPQIRNIPENTASYDLRESNLFVKEDTMNVIRSKNSDNIQSNIRKKDENKENENYTNEEIKTTLKGEIIKEGKDNIDIKCMKESSFVHSIYECKNILNVSGKDERKQADENKDSDQIESGHEKYNESMRGQNNTGEEDIKEAVKCKEMGQTDLEEKNKTENLKEDESNNNENFDEEGRRAIESEGNKQNDFILNDSILVRYFQRKTWKYFIGFVENIEFKDGENYYKVKFLKTVKDPFNSVKFVVQRKLDIDIVTILSIVKKVNLIQRESSKEYYLSNDFDMVYFN